MKSLPARIIIDCILFLAVFWLPWWLTVLIALGGLFFFDAFYEIIIAGFLIDSLYSLPLERFYHFQFVVTIGALVLFVFARMVKRRLRIYT